MYRMRYACRMATAVTITEARKNLFGIAQAVIDDHDPVEVTTRHGSVVIVSAEDWSAMEETAYLLRSPANAARLIGSLEKVRAGRYTDRELIDPEAASA